MSYTEVDSRKPPGKREEDEKTSAGPEAETSATEVKQWPDNECSLTTNPVSRENDKPKQ